MREFYLIAVSRTPCRVATYPASELCKSGRAGREEETKDEDRIKEHDDDDAVTVASARDGKTNDTGE